MNHLSFWVAVTALLTFIVMLTWQVGLDTGQFETPMSNFYLYSVCLIGLLLSGNALNRPHNSN